jgi:cation transport ATPase
MKPKRVGEEVRRRAPRFVMSLVVAIIFWIINQMVPPTISDLLLPGLTLSAGTLVGIITFLLTAVFLIRALSDGLILSDIVAEIVLKRLGIEEERSPKRAARDAIYIIVIILAVTALFPFLGTLDEAGDLLTTVTTYVALGLILILIYDMGRILYRIIEQRAESVADRLAKLAEQE